jgi:hypothetical protein
MLFAFTAGFATAGSITPEEYLHAKPDPLADFAGPVMKHMNEDHAKSIAEMVAHFTKIYCEEATMVEVDRLGFTVGLRTLVVCGFGYSVIHQRLADGRSG